MASATPNPYDHRWCRNRSVVSQSSAAGAPGMFSACGSAVTGAAAYAIRLVNGPWGVV